MILSTARKQQFHFDVNSPNLSTDIDYDPSQDVSNLARLPKDSLVKHQVAKTVHTDSADRHAGTRLALDGAGMPIDFVDSIDLLCQHLRRN